MPNNFKDPGSIELPLREYFVAGEPLRLADTPDFPLAFNVTLPVGFTSSNGNVGIRFEDFSVSGVESFHVNAGRSVFTADRVSLSLGWNALRVSGRYSVTAKASPLITMDTGGSMLDYEDDEIRPAGSPSVPPLDPKQKDAMLDQARAQRTRLMDSPNGQVLLSKYNEHNEVYNTVFVTSPAARTAWAAEGATKDMAEHTHSALDSKTTAVNPHSADATFGPKKVSYNENAFNQQLQIVVNTIATDPNFNPFDPDAKPDPNSKFTKASLAALTFGTGVSQTGNTKGVTKPLTGDGVYQNVDTQNKPAEATVEQLVNVLKQGAQPGGAAASVAEARNWRVLDEDDRRLVRRQLHAIASERAERDAVRVETLWSGACDAEFSGATAQIEFAVDDNGLRYSAATIALPAFEFELDDSTWNGEAADIVRERLGEVAFIRSLLRERIESGLADRIAEAARAIASR